MSAWLAAVMLLTANEPAALALAEIEARLPAPAARDVVAAQVDPYQRMTVPVRIGPDNASRFLVDTGAQNTVVSGALVQRLALRPSGSASVLGVAGAIHVDTVMLNDLRLGRRSFDGLLAPVLRQEDIGADGILGVDSLRGQRVLIDFEHDLITIDDAERSRGDAFDIVVRARRVSGQLILTSARIDGVPVDVVVDTGSSVTMGNRALQAALHRRGAAIKQAVLQSVTGQATVADVGIARSLSFGGMVLGNVAIAYIDAPPLERLGLAKRPTILLGMSELRAFKRVAIDFSRRKVLFDLREGTTPEPVARGSPP